MSRISESVSVVAAAQHNTQTPGGRERQFFDDPTGRRERVLRSLATHAVTIVLLLAVLLAHTLLFERWPAADTGPHDGGRPFAGKLVLPLHADPAVHEAWLRTLRAQGQRAIFAVAGTDVLKDPTRIESLAREGHGIVAAPFSGRPPSSLSRWQAEIELSATQLALAATVGAEAAWVHCSDVAPPPRWQRRGLRCAPLATAADDLASLKETTSEAASRVLVAALHASRGDGFGPQAAELQPAPLVHRALGAGVRALLVACDFVLRAAVVLTLVLFGIFLVRFTTVTTLMLARARRKAHAKRVADDDLPAITVIVPAYNEEAVIVATVSSLLGCAYPSPVQILVVDDGSTDGTLATARRAFDGHPQVRLLTKPNGGKCSALNLGIAEARTEIVVCIDADTQLDRDALRLLCRHFGDPDVGAVAGNPKVGNRINLLTRMQALEYVVLDSVERQALEGANAITCITGALGAYRRSLLETLGGYPGDTLAEDTDMTLLILRSGARVAYEEDAIAWTEAPETTRDFMKQRFRWMYGTVQAAFKYRAALFAQGSGSFGRVALPCLLLLQVGAGVLLLPLVDLVAVAGLAWLFAGGWFGWLVPGVSEMLRALDEHEAIFYALLGLTTMAAFAAAGVALHLDRREHLSRLLWLLPMQICFRVLLGMTAYRCILRAITGRHLAWGSLARTANVMVRAASAPSLQAKALARALLLVTVLATGAAAWQPVAAESPTATVVLYAPPSAVADGPELAPWHQWLYASGRRWREIASVHELVSAAPAVVLLPAARLLTEREVRALQRLQASGTALLVSGRIGAPQRDGTLPAGERLLGVALRPLVPPPGDGYHVSSIGHAPNTGSLPAGTRIAWREAAAWVPDTSRGTWLPAADFTTWSYRPVTGDVPLPAVLYGTHRGTRWVYLGFDAEWLDSDDAANVARLVADSLEWLAPAASAPRAQVAAWPPGYRSAQLVEMDTELAFRTDPRPLQHAIVLADILESVGARGSFYCVTSDVELSPAVLQRLAAGGHELGFHGEIHEQFAGQREPQQAARIATMLSQWQRLRPGTHGGGFRAPFEAYDVATERALVKAGIDYHVADPNAGPARLPHDAELGDGRRLLRLPRTQADDHVFTMGRQDAVTVARLLRVDADMAARSGALAVLSVHPQHFGIGAPVREAMPGLLEQLARPGSRVWLATGTEIASWWRTRERVRLQPLSDGLRIEVEPGPPIAGVTIIVNANLLARHIERADPSGARMLRALPWPAPDAPPWQSELRLFDLPAGVTEVRWGG